MTEKQEKIWAYRVKHPKAKIIEIAKGTGTSYGYVWKLMQKIGTPQEVLDAPKELHIDDMLVRWSDQEGGKEIAPRETNKRSNILSAADQLINGERHEEYGDASDSFERIAGYWNAHLGLNNFISPRDVAAMMVLLKISRLHGDGPKDVDTYIDICGYAAIGGEIAGSD
jgi:predicted DNA-binding transcriptional regulator AlpA